MILRLASANRSATPDFLRSLPSKHGARTGSVIFAICMMPPEQKKIMGWAVETLLLLAGHVLWSTYGPGSQPHVGKRNDSNLGSTTSLSVDKLGRPRMGVTPRIATPERPPDLPSSKIVGNPSLFKASHFEAYLREHDGEVSAWKTVYDLSTDREFLLAAIDRFPEDRSLRLRPAYSSQDPVERRASLEEYANDFPDDSVAHYALAVFEAKAGEFPEFYERLRNALQLAPPVAVDAKDILHRRDALRSLGYSNWEAGAFAAFSNFEGGPNCSLLGPVFELEQQIEAGGDPVELASLGVAIAALLRRPDDKSFFSHFMIDRMAASMLERLPADFEYGETGRAVAEELALTQERIAQLQSLDAATRFWNEATEAEKEACVNRMLVDGETKPIREWADAHGIK